MNPEEFIKRIRRAVYDSSIDGTLLLLEKPPGRRPSQSLETLSEWYNELSSNDRDKVKEVVQLAVRAAVFGMLSVVDGVISIRDPEEDAGDLELRYKDGIQSVLLNSASAEPLHDIFAREIPPT